MFRFGLPVKALLALDQRTGGLDFPLQIDLISHAISAAVGSITFHGQTTQRAKNTGRCSCQRNGSRLHASITLLWKGDDI